MTMADCLDTLQQHKDVWTVVLGMSVVRFASILSGGPRVESAAQTRVPAKRTRISDVKKNSIKGAIVSVLGQHKDGLSRTEIVGQTGDDVLATIGVKRDDLAAKLRQPLVQLVGDKKLHTVGEKRLMKYHAGAKK